MYYVPDDTKKCGFYQCSLCKEKFLSLSTIENIDCIYCEKDVDYEIGPDEEMNQVKETARLISILQGEDVEKYDTLLSLAVTGGNYDWI